MQKVLTAVGRICLSLIFLLSGIGKLIHWHEREQSLVGAINDLLSNTQGLDWVHSLLSSLLPWTGELLVLGIIFELGGSILVFSGYRARLGALILAIFLIPTTLLYHHFWLLQGSDRELQMIMFLKNLSIFGGLLILFALGAGRDCFNSKSSAA
jgi:uncharacterized membrane protein YphA (DoxX/SURF4 family)